MQVEVGDDHESLFWADAHVTKLMKKGFRVKISAPAQTGMDLRIPNLIAAQKGTKNGAFRRMCRASQ